MPTERQKRKESTTNGVFKTPDYSRIELNAELREKVKQEVNKRP
jgi:hypothetical protein